MNISVSMDDGWLASLPAATQDFVMRKLIKAQSNPKRPVSLTVTGTGVMRSHSPSVDLRAAQNRTAGWKHLADVRSRDFSRVPPYFGAEGGK